MNNIFSIWSRRKQGDSGFETLVAPHIENLYRLAYRFYGTRNDAEDLVQELLTRLYPKHREIAAIEHLGAWLNKSLYHLFIDLNRRSKHAPALLDDIGIAVETAPSEQCSPDTSLARQLDYTRLQKALLKLNADQRSLIALHDMEGYNLPDLANLLEIPPGTLKSRLHRARATLRELLAEFDE